MKMMLASLTNGSFVKFSKLFSTFPPIIEAQSAISLRKTTLELQCQSESCPDDYLNRLIIHCFRGFSQESSAEWITPQNRPALWCGISSRYHLPTPTHRTSREPPEEVWLNDSCSVARLMGITRLRETKKRASHVVAALAPINNRDENSFRWINSPHFVSSLTREASAQNKLVTPRLVRIQYSRARRLEIMMICLKRSSS